MNNGVFLLIILSGLVLAGCAPPPPSNEESLPESNNSAIANPASKNCEEKGGKVVIRTGEDGSQAGYCVFSDGSECEEWAFLRGECSPGSSNLPTPIAENTLQSNNTQEAPSMGATIANPASKYCEEHGGRIELRTQPDGSQAGYCIFPDNSECEEWSYLRGECAPTDITSIFTSVIANILSRPNDYLEQEVLIIGYFRGWDLLGEAGNPPPVTRSDWVIKDNSAAMYITAQGGVEVPLDPSSKDDTAKIIKVIGLVNLADSGSPYLSLKSIEIINTP